MPATIDSTTTTQFAGDLLDFARDHAERCALSLAEYEQFSTMMHVVSGEECTTTRFALDGIDARELDLLVGMATRLVSTLDVKWVAMQIGVWVDITGDVAGMMEMPKPHALASEGLAVIVVDGEGADFWVAEVHRELDGASLRRWHCTQRGPVCGVRS